MAPPSQTPRPWLPGRRQGTSVGTPTKIFDRIVRVLSFETDAGDAADTMDRVLPSYQQAKTLEVTDKARDVHIDNLLDEAVSLEAQWAETTLRANAQHDRRRCMHEALPSVVAEQTGECSGLRAAARAVAGGNGASRSHAPVLGAAHASRTSALAGRVVLVRPRRRRR